MEFRLGMNGQVIPKEKFDELRKRNKQQIELMKIIVDDDLNLLKDKDQTIDEYQIQKQSYQKTIDFYMKNKKEFE
tara:strand:+ start:640 stop:864 length:225 start_codon:yes stop_codon:yes gene_type:complete